MKVAENDRGDEPKALRWLRTGSARKQACTALPYFLGLLVTLPVLAHATWHLYRRIVVPAAS